MNRKKLLIATLVIVVVITLGIATTIILLRSASTITTDNSQQELDTTSYNEFGYTFEIPVNNTSKTYHFESDQETKILNTELVHLDIPLTRDYEIPGTEITTYDLSVLNNGTLIDWINSQTQKEFDGSQVYVSNFIKSLRGDDIYIMVNTNSLYVFAPAPVLFIKTNTNIYTISLVFMKNEYNAYMDLIKTLKIKEMQPKMLTDSEFNEINSYFKEDEKN